MMKLNTVMPLMASIILFYTAEAFSPAPKTSLQRFSSTVGVVAGRNAVQLQASEDGEDFTTDVGLPPLPSQKGAPPKEEPAPASVKPVAAASNAVEEKDQEASYPIDLPSPVLLSTSMFLAISSIGSIFELTGGHPSLGFVETAAIAAIGLPSSLYLIYAAILKGAAETAEDDAEYNTRRPL
mmetsp:Transcript_23988/g.42964  ORF Transcript_23988/g.42964 Transcript_23988/m.42964 type:complete len:182 (+) Transcript_23988:87-632(+)|eukprot:CAMPEP_0201869870 /NCGR_PEP_ID=MMETSP0902-20130614/3221_1 /ASSEMBLY_ACC=CAM_ASM_000551 /TAXON_ID=420261 /ORGANISM="Thalassiosira antarctica, Strain CCMP982" /LENGTH=181 /DNA_ID=CAMNT_0048395429 /DNA_START=27 /DNA_END=572 /DNA_ORIENTATION=+